MINIKDEEKRLEDFRGRAKKVRLPRIKRIKPGLITDDLVSFNPEEIARELEGKYPPKPVYDSIKKKEIRRKGMGIYYESTLRGIRSVSGDKSISLEEILEDLQGLRDEIELGIEAIEADIENKKEEEENG